jgi:hypothetical protein
METNLDDTVAGFLIATAYHHCLLLVHTEIPKLDAAAEHLDSIYGWPSLSIGRELAAVLVSESPGDRPAAARRWMETTLAKAAPGPILVTGVDLLFEPALKLDPVALLRQASRRTTLLVTWPGSYASDVLAYAVPRHSHYRTWHKPDLSVCVLD